MKTLKSKKGIVLVGGFTILLVCGIVLTVVGGVWQGFCILILWAAMLMAGYINYIAYKNNSIQLNPFGTYSMVRNVDLLIIGDLFDPSDILKSGQSYVQIAAPGRTMEAAFELLRHTHSILNDETGKSEIILAVCRKNLNKCNFSVWDVPFFHRITVERYRLQILRRMSKVPIIIDFYGTIRMLLGKKSKGYIEELCGRQDMEAFCRERGYNLRLFVKD